VADGGQGRGARPEAGRSAREWLAVGQGVYYAVTGAWPLVSMGSFERVTGAKREHWLVKTVGLLLVAVGGSLALAGARRRVTPETALLAAGCATALGAVDTVYAARRRISPVYLLDAVGEAALTAAWIGFAGPGQRRAPAAWDRAAPGPEIP
jgi:hypothetical protein